MEGRLVVEQGSIYDLIAIAKSNTRPELAGPVARLQHARRSLVAAPFCTRRAEGGAGQRRSSLRPGRAAVPALPRRRHAVFLRLLRAARHDARPGAASEEAADRLEAAGAAGSARARHRLRLGRPRALPRAGLRCRRDRHHAQPGAASGGDRARGARGPVGPGALSAAGLPPGAGDLRQHRLGRDVRARGAGSTRSSSAA